MVRTTFVPTWVYDLPLERVLTVTKPRGAKCRRDSLSGAGHTENGKQQGIKEISKRIPAIYFMVQAFLPDSVSDQARDRRLNVGHSSGPFTLLGHLLHITIKPVNGISRTLSRETHNKGYSRWQNMQSQPPVKVAGIIGMSIYTRLPVVPEGTGVVGGLKGDSPVFGRLPLSGLNS